MYVTCRSVSENLDAVKLSPVVNAWTDSLNETLKENGYSDVNSGSLLRTSGKLYLANSMVHCKKSTVGSRNSYTVEFLVQGKDCSSYGYVLAFIQHEFIWYAVIQRIQLEEWAHCTPQDSDLSDILSTHGNLHMLLKEHIFPAQETPNL